MTLPEQACDACQYAQPLNKAELFFLVRSYSENKGRHTRIFNAKRMHAPAYRIPIEDQGLTVDNVIEHLQRKRYLEPAPPPWLQRTTKGNLITHTFRELVQQPGQLPAAVPSQQALAIDWMLHLRDRTCKLCEEHRQGA